MLSFLHSNLLPYLNSKTLLCIVTDWPILAYTGWSIVTDWPILAYTGWSIVTSSGRPYVRVKISSCMSVRVKITCP